ncbi:MAG: protoglobin family protein [bacterium]
MTEPYLGNDFSPKKFANDPEYRWDYFKEFLDFNEDDWRRVQSTEDIIRPEIPTIVRNLYDVLLGFEPTAELYRDEDGSVDPSLIEDRVEGFELWFERIFETRTREEYLTYLAKVGAIHTDQLGFEEMVVDEAHLGPTFSWLMNQVNQTLTGDIRDPDRLAGCLSAWQRFFSLQLAVFRMAYESTE